MNKIYNREISWLEFNDRVLQEAEDKSVPLLQRLRFLGIFSNNQDEFVKVRVANLMRYSAIKGRKKITMTGGYPAAELLPMVNKHIDRSQSQFRKAYDAIIEEMEGEGIYMADYKNLNEEQTNFCRDYFLSVVSVRLSPIIIRKREPLPFLPDGKGYLAIKMESESSAVRYAIIQIPVSDASPRFVKLPTSSERTEIIFLDDIIRLFLDDIFFMFSYDKISAYTFKIMRDAELALDDDVSKSMAEKMFEGITMRNRGKAVRLIYDKHTPEDILTLLMTKFKLNRQSLHSGGRYHLMRDLMRFPKVRQELESHSPKPLLHPEIDPCESVLKVIKRKDLLLSYPYQTFNHFIDLLREAAIDPLVQSIYITLYRTASNSKVINALLNAASNGKQVTVLIELKARFDEERNIDSTEILQEGGVKVLTSQEVLKVHSKLVLIERREGNSTRGYVYVGTGNFNENTSTIYSDFGLLTANPTIAQDARGVFEFLENTHKHPKCRELLVSPYYMREMIEDLIEREIRYAKRGERAYFKGKFNSLTDEKMIKLLYRASQAGVTVDLLVRGACCLKAQVEGLSENITVRSIVDKYLEHARLMIFCNGGRSSSYILSADLMTRNLDRRVEVGIPIKDASIHATLVEYFDMQWRDNVKAREIAPPFDNRYFNSAQQAYRSQDEIYHQFKETL